MLWALFAAALAAYTFTPAAAITTNRGGTYLVVNTESSNGFRVEIDMYTCDINKMWYGSAQLQSGRKDSHVGIGLLSVTASFHHQDNMVVVKCVVNDNRYDLTHYMIFRDKEDRIYMGTKSNADTLTHDLRYVFRVKDSLPGTVPAYPEGDVSNVAHGKKFEGTDVILVNGQTRSKFYAMERFIDTSTYCATDRIVNACVVLPDTRSTEKSSGGPFFRDVGLNYNGKYHTIHFYMNSQHAKIEDFRQGFHGPYVFSVTRNSVPRASDVDVNFFDKLGLDGYVGASGRGFVRGTATGVSADLPIVIHWFNNDYQSWTYASKNGSFTSPALVKGEYTMILYQDEFKAAMSKVMVEAGKTATVDIVADAPVLTTPRTTIFKLGEYDGRPTGFLNADKQLRMHPGDARMAPWAAGSVDPLKKGAAAATAAWPMAIFQDVNNGAQNLTFSLDTVIAGHATLRIATTLSYLGGRLNATVNGFVCPAPPEPQTIWSHSITLGTYRGYNEVYDCVLPEGTLVRGTNTIHITVSGPWTKEKGFLSPSVVFDAIELFHPNSEKAKL